jgi:serine/threonine protein kinase
LVCVSKEIVGEGSYGEVIKCGSNKVIKKGDSFDREFNFLEKTKTKTTEKSPWVRMYRIATLETKRFAMDAVTTTLNKAQIGPNNINKYTCRLIRSLKKFHAETDYTHNDIKPDNIGVMSNGSIKLIDLGSVLERTASHTSNITLYSNYGRRYG